jgi:hypothetical protein
MALCPLCGGDLIEVRAKAVCSACGRICEGCCEGAPAPAGAERAPDTGRNDPAAGGGGR